MSNVINVVVKNADSTNDDVTTPDTGWYTSTTSQNQNTTTPMLPIMAGVGFLLAAAILLMVFSKKKMFNTKNRTKKTGYFFVLAALVLSGIGTLVSAITSNVAAKDDIISFTSSDTTITVVREAGADTAYGIATAKITLNDATPLGYNVFAYTPDGNVLKTDTGDGAIKPVAEDNSALTNNTWGIALTSQTDVKAEDKVWNAIGEEDSPLLVASFDNSTAAGTTVILHYGVLIDSTLPVGVYSANVEYKAYQRAYNITFDAGEGKVAESTKPVMVGEAIGTLPTPTRTNYNFLGWYTEKTGGTKIDENTVPSGNSTYYAHYSSIGYTIIYNANGRTFADDSTTNQVDYVGNSTTGTYKEPVGTNTYVFMGWGTASTDTVAIYTTEDQVKAYYGASSGQTVTLYAVWANALTVYFDGNGNTEGTMGPMYIPAGTSQNLPANTFEKDGYEFMGWNTDANGEGVAYGDEISFSAEAVTPGQTMTLYAQWKKTLCVGYTTMQSLNASNINTLLPNVNDTAVVCDMRDEQNYTIGKLADNKIWMLENLNLAGGTALSADDTDVTSTYINGFTTGGNLTKDGDTIVLPDSSTSGFNDGDSAFVYNSGNKTNCGAIDQDAPCYSYYSWIAATLGGKQADGATAETRDGYNAAASICPKGWKLPTSTTSNADATTSLNWKTGDWYTLATAYGVDLENGYYQSSDAFYNNAGPGTIPNFLLAGYYYSDSFDDSGIDGGMFDGGGMFGLYWSATSVFGGGADLSYFSPFDVSSAGSDGRELGPAVRCMIDPANKHDVTVSMDTNTESVTFDSDMYGSQTVTTDGGTVSLREGVTYTITALFARGYGFSGWSNTANSMIGDASSNPTTYTVTGDSTLTIASKEREVVTFDKAYELAGKTKHNGYYTMQDATSAICTAVETGQTGTLIDTRDDTTYRVAKLADDKCWMLENLALDLTSQSVKDAMYSSTADDTYDTGTNAKNSTLGYLFNGGGSSPYTNYAVANATSSNHYDRPAIAKSGTCNNAYCVNNPTSGNWTYDSVTQATINDVNSYAQGKIGIYYNFCAASAGSYCYASNASVDRPDTAKDAIEDICPSGWRMPTGGPISTSGDNNGGGEFQNLYYKYNNTKSFQEALSTPLSGNFYNGKAYGQGNDGNFWSSTRNNGNFMYVLYVNSTYVYPQSFNGRDGGFSMRCIVGS